MDIERIFGKEVAEKVEGRMRKECPAPSRWWEVRLGQSSWTVDEEEHLASCSGCGRILRQFEKEEITARAATATLPTPYVDSQRLAADQLPGSDAGRPGPQVMTAPQPMAATMVVSATTAVAATLVMVLLF